jgi:ribosomal protein S18 acetylase RimI-like enzyme
LTVRPYQPTDRAAVERICIDHGLRGNLEKYFIDKDLFAKIWLAPFLDGEPDAAWVIEADGAVVGYLVAAIKDGFKMRAVRILLPYLAKMAANSIAGKYRHHPPSRRFVKWFLFRSWREVPAHPPNTSNFHFNIDSAFQGSARGGEALAEAYFNRLKELGHTHFYIHVFASSTKRALGFYRYIGFKIVDAKLSSLFHEPTVVTSMLRTLPETVSLGKERVKFLPKLTVRLRFRGDLGALESALTEISLQALPADAVVIEVESDPHQALRDLAERFDARLSREPGSAGKDDIVVTLDPELEIRPEFLALILAAYDSGTNSGVVQTDGGEAFFTSRKAFATGEYPDVLPKQDFPNLNLRLRLRKSR